MVKHCEKCGKKLNQEAFICPHCGHIIGEPVHTVPRHKQERNLPWRKILGTLGVMMLIVGFLAAAWGISRFVKDLDTTVPTTAPTEPPATLAPLVNYRVELSADTKHWLSGITVHFCKDGQDLYSGQVDADGMITFIAPKGEGYSIRLSNLFPALDYHYGNIDIPFQEGTNILRYHLANKDIQYAVRVVNTAGDPVPDVKVQFNAHNGTFIKNGLTDSDGEAFFKSSYDPLCYATMLSVPDQYIMVDTKYSYEFGSFVNEIVLMTYEECHVGPENLFTIRVRDEYGEPVKDLFVFIYGQIGDDVTTWVSLACYTNQQGNITLTADDDYSFQVRIPYNPDYADIRFSFEEGSHELDIQLQLHTPLDAYTYTVKFVDQFGMPVPGVEISYKEAGLQQIFQSAENGIVTFSCEHWDPSNVKVQVWSVPVGYNYVNTNLDKRLSFPTDSRSLTIELESITEEYNIYLYWVTDGISSKMPGTEFTIFLGGKRYFCTVDYQGKCTVELPYFESSSQMSIEITRLAEKYQDYVIDSIDLGGNTGFRYISIRLSPKPEPPAEEGSS